MADSLNARLDQLIPPAPEPLDLANLEPMPAEAPVPDLGLQTAEEPGMPSMDGVQIAGIGSVLRGALGRAGKKAGRGAADEPVTMIDAAPVKMTDEVKPAAAVPAVAPKPARPTILNPKQLRAIADEATGKGKPTEGEVFNYDLFDDASVAKLVQSIAKDSGVDYTRVTKDDVLKQVNDLGFDDGYLRGLDGQARELKDLPATVLRSAFAVPSQVKRLETVLEKISKEGETPELMQELMEQYALSAHVIKAAKGIQASPAQALAVLNQGRPVMDISSLKAIASDPNVSQGLKEVVTAITQLTDVAAKAKLIEKVSKVGLTRDAWMTTYINGLLSSPVSHAKNMTANSMFGLYQIPERLVGAFYSNVLPKGVRDWKALVPGAADEKIAFDEALTMIQSLRSGFGEGLELAARAWRTNQPVLDTANKLENDSRMGLGETLQRLTNADPSSWFGKGLDYYGTAVTLPGRALLTEDEFFKGVLYRMEINTQIARRGKQVYRDAIDNGMPEADAIARAESEVLALHKNPPDDLDELAMEFARQGTFTADLPPALERLQQVFNHPALKIIVPFFKTPANIGLNVVERTPFAFTSSRWRADMAAGGVQRDMAMAKVTLGSTLLATFAMMAAEGNITGGGPKRPADREAFMRTGAQPYSIKIGDNWYSYTGMEPVGALLAIAADYAEYAQQEPDKGKVEQVFLGGVYGLYEYLKEQPYLQGVADITRAIGLGRQGGEVDGAKIVNEISKQVGGFAIGGSPGGVYSSLMAGIERVSDPEQRGVRTNPELPMGVRGFYEAFNKYRSRLPYFSKDLPEDLTLWGDPIMRGQGKPMELVLPTRVSPDQFSEVDDALLRLGSPVGMPDKKLEGIEMDSFQYNRLLTIYGKELNAKQLIMETIIAPGFDLMSLKDQQQTLQRVHSKLMQQAKMQLKQEYPDLQAKIEELDTLRDANGLYYKPD